MRVFVAGASGAIGTRLVPQLIDAGHEVIGTFRSPGGVERLRALGAEPVALDLLEARAVREAVLASEPEAIVHQATALANLRTSSTSIAVRGDHRLRTEGTDALRAAAREAGGIALRYGTVYGASNDELVEPVSKRQFPIAGNGGGRTSFIHLDDPAAAPVLALEREGGGVYNIVDERVPRRLEREGQAGANRIARPERGTHRPRRPLRFAQGRPAVADDEFGGAGRSHSQ